MAKSVTPTLMFTGDAEAAMNYYVSLFPAQIEFIDRHDANGSGKASSVKQAVLVLNGQKLICLDSPPVHAFTFTPSISLTVDCESAAEVDELFAKLSEGGKILMPLDAYPFARRFAWLNDKFGVSWQLRFA